MKGGRQSFVAVVLAFLVAISMGLIPMGALAAEEGLSQGGALSVIEELEEEDEIEFGISDVNLDNLHIALGFGDYEEGDDNGEFEQTLREDDGVLKEFLTAEEPDEDAPMPDTRGGGSDYVPPDRGEPDLSADLSDNEVASGVTEELEFQISNDGKITTGSGEGVTDAQSVTVKMDDDGPFDAQIDEVSIGPVQDGGVSEAVFPVNVPADIEPGEYDVTLEIDYTYAETIGTDGSVDRTSDSTTRDVTIEVPDEPRFDVTDLSTNAEPGTSGSANIEIENTGTEAANNTQATITGSGGVIINGEVAEEHLGDLKPNETTTTSVNVDLDKSTSDGAKPIDFEFSYEDENGILQGGITESASLAPMAEQEFSIQNVAEDLAVGYNGDITGQVHNDGPRTIDDAVLVAEPMSESLFIEDTYYALPEIEPGETADFHFPTDVSGQADSGDRQMQFSVEYTGGDNSPLEDGPHSERVVVDDYQDEFAIEGDNISVPQDGTEEFTLEITNDRSGTLSNIDAMLYTSGELNTDNDEAFVDKLEPGETAEITFDVSASGQATTETHPIELDFQYDTERGDTTVSDTYQHPIEVENAEDGGGGITGTLFGILGAFTVAGVGITLWWQRR